MTLSKVKLVQASGSFENDFGAIQDNPELPNHGKKLLYKFEYEFEDNVVMTANHKTNTSPFPAGTEVDYNVTKTHPEYGKSGKVQKPESANFTPNASKGGGNDDARQLMIVRQSSLKVALDVILHNSGGNKTDAVITPIDPVDVVELAGRFVKWVMQEEPKAQPEKVQEIAKEVESKLGEQPGDPL